ncbi:ATP-grasp domain-containing protein (plasmid) [Bacillus cereus]|uniref:ATP-grasp domain-containing protein n=1 Tax=Bacillus cereus TaxID=1396 RepID=A0AB73UTB3_BACCE|nr:ATP-grasp domain-containing protein [Bacillus cereus]HDR3523488.1 ATP-grasp domain-containing protein [Bacillus pacificus]QHV07980.1 hypothetical protein C1N82_32815 [Bacillus cereus]QHV47441.1 ATP-grasp domain-containing protein [Bacillus cereus]HDR3634045.1 ATP-grasp domain-containing protein [Bacillus pacificus]HDR7652981.1 ATP-grasp domain-containing protein [Bacillus pacificus]
MNQSVILVESGNRGAEIAAFRQLGYNVILLTTGLIPYDSCFQEQANQIISDKKLIHYEILEEKIRELHDIYSIKTVCSTSDFFIYNTSLICEKYCYPFLNSNAAYTFHFKNKFRNKQKELNYNFPEYHHFQNISDALQFYNETNKKQWVFKPVNGNESVAVKLIHSETDLMECYKQLQYLSRFTGSLMQPEFLLEEYIEGNIYSCEFIAENDQIQILGVTNRLMSNPPFFVELGYNFPIENSIAQEIIEETKRFVYDFQYLFGPCHIEYIIGTDKTIYILEVNPRLVGPPNPWMIDRSLDFSVFNHICKLFINGKTCEIPTGIPKFTTCLEVTSPIDGYLKNILVDQSYLIRDDVQIIFMKEKNEYIRKASSNTDILARILTVAETLQEAQRLANEIYEKIQLEIKIKPLLNFQLNNEWLIKS